MKKSSSTEVKKVSSQTTPYRIASTYYIEETYEEEEPQKPACPIGSCLSCSTSTDSDNVSCLKKRKVKQRRKRAFVVRAGVYRDNVAGEEVFVNCHRLLFQVEKGTEGCIVKRTNLTPPNFELTRQYYREVKRTYKLVTDVVNKLGKQLMQGKVEGDINDWKEYLNEITEKNKKETTNDGCFTRMKNCCSDCPQKICACCFRRRRAADIEESEELLPKLK